MSNHGQWFETRKRDSGESFVTLKDGAPEWLTDSVRDAHNGTMPNDWIYAECRAAVDAYDDGNLVDGDCHEHADSRVDVYIKALYQWAADMCTTDLYSDAQSEAFELGEPRETEKIIGVIQYCAIRRIAETMYAACDAAEDCDDDTE